MLTGGSGDQNLAPLQTPDGDDTEEMLSRVRSLLVFSVENRGPKIDKRSGAKKADVMMERWKAIFSKYDSEGSGTLNIEDVKRMVRQDLKIAKRLVTDGQLDELFAAIDEDGGGSVEFSEFLEFVQKPSNKGIVSQEEVVKSVARGVRLALRRNKINPNHLEGSFRSFEESGDISTGELGPNDMARFFRRILKLSKHECTDKALRVTFYAMDDDGSGTMSLDEFMEFIKFCSLEEERSALPDRVPGLIGGMNGALPKRAPSRRPGTTSGTPKSGAILTSGLPFCINGRDLKSTSRLGSTQRSMFRSTSEPSLHTLGIRTSQSSSFSRTFSSSMNLLGGSLSDSMHSEEPLSPISAGSSGDRSPRKRVWSGKLPGKSHGGYMLLKGAEALNKVEERLFEAGIDVRGHYHKLGRDRPPQP